MKNNALNCIPNSHRLTSAVLVLSTVAIAATSFLALLGGIANSQTFDPLAEAESSLQGITPTEQITDDVLENVVVPFETNDPVEADLTHATIQNEIDQRQVDGTDIGGTTFDALREGFIARDDVEINRDDPLNIVTEHYSDTADQRVGDLFTSDGTGICTQPTFEGIPEFEGICERSAEFSVNLCNEAREISLDRRDTWQCEVIPNDVLRHCDQEVRMECGATTNCMAKKLNTHSDGDVTETFGPTSTALHMFNVREAYWIQIGPDSGDGYWFTPANCEWKTHTFNFEYGPDVNITNLSLSGIVGTTMYKIFFNGTHVGEFLYGFAPSTCGPHNSPASIGDIDLLSLVQPGTNTLLIEHMVGSDNSLNMTLNHGGGCCWDPQTSFEEVSCD